ncbi:hypothetical protein [uncultured Anaerococcus sp.]|uniref:hypothetical protein n=1 Tax=uncultured Anaerococcus sp. TaxID=293428 RepID=UPI00288AF7B8|nr:hypothetical protein [uncultured Anaerococcus sp.]
MAIKIKGFKKANREHKCLCKASKNTINEESAQYPLRDTYLRVLQTEASIVFDKVMKQAVDEIYQVLTSN